MHVHTKFQTRMERGGGGGVGGGTEGEQREE